MDDDLLRQRLLRWLFVPKFSIPLIAWFVRKLADRLAAYSGPRGNQLAKFASLYACGDLDLGLFARSADQWTSAHVGLLGWKYNTGHIEHIDDMEGIRGWGDMFIYCYADIVSSGIFD